MFAEIEDGWVPLSEPPRRTGRYIVAHRGHAEITYYLSPRDRVWLPHTKIGWQEDHARFRATHYRPLPELD